MHRDYFLKQLERYQSYDAQEAASRLTILNFIQHNPDCFLKTNPLGHITGSAWLVDFSEKKFLLTLHRKCKRWLQCGGHGEGETDPLKIALREAKEESGLPHIIPLQTEIFDVDAHYFNPPGCTTPHWHYDIRYLLKVSTSDDSPQQSGESLSLRWFIRPPSPQPPHFLGRLYQKWLLWQQR